jgi:hypothetical protein
MLDILVALDDINDIGNGVLGIRHEFDPRKGAVHKVYIVMSSLCPSTVIQTPKRILSVSLISLSATSES